MVGKQGNTCPVTLVDRKSLYLLDRTGISKTAVAAMCAGQSHLSVRPNKKKRGGGRQSQNMLSLARNRSV